jgi:NAD(P)-dependent dehydrogenase (short-subunit alcohol dehydrogenase family)
MPGKLTGRRILITGAAGGMGRSIAEVFSAEGAALALLDRNVEGVGEVAAKLGAKSYPCDVASKPDVEKALAQAIAGLHGLDGIVNAAGILVTPPFDELDSDSLERMLRVNLVGPFNIIKSSLWALREAKQATVVNIASVSAFLPTPGSAGYSASKAGLVMLTKCLAYELGPRIRCNTVCPGVIRTEMTRYLWENPEHTQRAADRTALKRLGDPEEVASAALYLSSAELPCASGQFVILQFRLGHHLDEVVIAPRPHLGSTLGIEIPTGAARGEHGSLSRCGTP